jgi:tRNA 5-methylaminomethyl-2-thiouridine biosynthesis bifunctional protein
MRATLAALGLPPDYVQALDAAAASDRAGVVLPHPAWFYPGGGWLDPGRLARAFLDHAGTRTRWCGSSSVERIEEIPGAGWGIVDAAGRRLATAPVLVLANAADALRLLDAGDWPIEHRRGQLSCLSAAAWADAGLPAPHVPVAGAGYLLPVRAGQLCFGATSQIDDADPGVRAADHRANLTQLERLLGRRLAIDLGAATGRTAWRCSSRDRLPLVGGVPDRVAIDAAARLDQARFVPRRPGLFVYTALGSRGITWSALGAQVIAAGVSGTPMPLEADLLDAIDPARFLVRTWRRR